MSIGTLLEDLTWLEAEKALHENAIIVIPLGAAAKEHGPHLKLNNDWRIAEYLKARVLEAADVVVAPTVSYHYYPAFVEYPGSTSLSHETACNLIVDICRSLAKFGPKRFYVINTGVSTMSPLAAAANVLFEEGITLDYTDILTAIKSIGAEVCEQQGGTHADETETSMMLYIAPGTVDMSQAVEDYDAKGSGPLSRTPGKGKYSPTGVFGNATLATREKGGKIVEALVTEILADIETLREH
jgi:creatinine amidohydrolase